MTCSSRMQSCIEGSSDWSSCTGLLTSCLASSSGAGLCESCRQGQNSGTIPSLFFTDLYLSIPSFSSSSCIKPASHPYSLPRPALEVKVPSQGIYPLAMTGAWWEGSFLHQPSKGWSEMRLALGNLSILSVSWSVYEFHFRDEWMPTAKHIHFSVQKL